MNQNRIDCDSYAGGQLKLVTTNGQRTLHQLIKIERVEVVDEHTIEVTAEWTAVRNESKTYVINSEAPALIQIEISSLTSLAVDCTETERGHDYSLAITTKPDTGMVRRHYFMEPGHKNQISEERIKGLVTT